jgi:hypothetical protein
MILWRIEPLPRKYLETNNEATAVAMQQRGKHVSTKIELLLETAFSTRSVQWKIIGTTQLVENQFLKRRLGSWCEMAASLEVVGYQLLGTPEREAVEIGPKRGKLKYLHC